MKVVPESKGMGAMTTEQRTTIDELLKSRISLISRKTLERGVARLRTLIANDENLLDLASCTKETWTTGLLAVTDRRIIFFDTKGAPEQLPHAELGNVEVGTLGTALVVSTSDGPVSFGTLSKAQAAELAGRLPSLRDAQKTSRHAIGTLGEPAQVPTTTTEDVPRLRPRPRSTVPWHQRPIVVVIALVFVAPIGIGLAWWHKLWSQRTRIIASVASAAFMIFALVGSQLQKQEEQEAKRAAIDTQKRKEEDQKRAEAEERQRQDEVKRAAEEKQKEAEQQRLVEERKTALRVLKSAAATFVGLQTSKVETQLVAYQELIHALGEAQKINADGTEPYVTAVAEIASVQKRLDELDQTEKAAATVPDAPEKPVYEKPLYTGAFFLGGNVRGNYEGAPVVQAGSKFYVVKGAGIWLEGDYVEPTTETVTLNIGRDGRDATIVNAAARETYNDDQKAYTEEVKKAKADYDEEMKAYRTAVKEKATSDAALKKQKAERATLRASLVADRDRLLPALAAKLSSAPSP